MNQRNDNQQDDAEQIEPEEAPLSEAGPEDAGADGGAEVALLQKEIARLKDQLLRSAADYQNMARRAQNNVAEAREQQLLSIAKSLVPVIDHFDRALAVDTAKVSTESILQGVQIVGAEMQKVLEKFGIKRMEVNPGDEFDPKRHEALLRQKVEGITPGHVAAVLQPGYVLNDRTLRPAQVSMAE